MIVLAAGFTEQAQVTNWPARIALVLIMIAIIGAVLGAMLPGWRARQRRQADIPAPHPVPDRPQKPDVSGSVDSRGISALYVRTATAGNWLERIAVHGLGVRSRAELDFSPAGIAIERQGAATFFIPTNDVIQVRTDRGVAGTVRAKDSVIVVTWRLGEHEVDSGFRADDSTDHRTLLDGHMAAFPHRVLGEEAS